MSPPGKCEIHIDVTICSRRAARACLGRKFPYLFLLQNLCQAEIQDLRNPFRVDENVGRLDVSVNDAPLVRGLEPVSDLDGKLCHL